MLQAKVPPASGYRKFAWTHNDEPLNYILVPYRWSSPPSKVLLVETVRVEGFVGDGRELANREVWMLAFLKHSGPEESLS